VRGTFFGRGIYRPWLAQEPSAKPPIGGRKMAQSQARGVFSASAGASPGETPDQSEGETMCGEVGSAEWLEFSHERNEWKHASAWRTARPHCYASSVLLASFFDIMTHLCRPEPHICHAHESDDVDISSKIHTALAKLQY
jgi:hypothetical protein